MERTSAVSSVVGPVASIEMTAMRHPIDGAVFASSAHIAR
jgi:hypothetical protein